MRQNAKPFVCNGFKNQTDRKRDAHRPERVVEKPFFDAVDPVDPRKSETNGLVQDENDCRCKGEKQGERKSPENVGYSVRVLFDAFENHKLKYTTKILHNSFLWPQIAVFRPFSRERAVF